MRKRNRKSVMIISIICAIIIIVAMIYSNSNTQNISVYKNNSEAIQLNEEYTKEDFEFDETGKILEGFSDKGKEKYIRNDYSLVLDGNVLGDIEEIGYGAFASVEYYDEEYYSKSLKKLEFRNLESLKVIGMVAFQQHRLEGLDLSPLKNLQKIDVQAFLGNGYGYSQNKKMKINLSGLEKLEEIGGEAFYLCGIEGILDLSDLKNLKVIDTAAFSINNISNINFGNVENLEKISSHAFQNNKITDINFGGFNNLSEIEKGAFAENPNLKEIDLTKTPRMKVEEGAFDEETKIKLTYNQFRYIGGTFYEIVNYNLFNEGFNVEHFNDLYSITLEFNEKVNKTDSLIETTEKKISELFSNEEEKEKWLKDKGFVSKEERIMNDFETAMESLEKISSVLDEIVPWEKSDSELEQLLIEYKKRKKAALNKYEEHVGLVLEELDTKLKEEIEKLNIKLGKIKEDIKINDNSKEIEDGINELKGKCILQTSIDNLKTKLDNLRNFQKTIKEGIEELDRQVSEFSTNHNERITENTELNTLMKNLTKEVTGLMEYNSNLENKVKEFDTEINKLEAFDCEGINEELSKIEKDIENLENNDNTKKKDITSLNGKLVNAEKVGKVTEDIKQGLLNDLTTLETKQNAEKEELANIEKELKTFKETNAKALEIDADLKAKEEALTNRINELKESINGDDTTITDLRTRIEKLEVIDPAKEKAKEELNKLKQEVDKTIPDENTEADNIKKKLDEKNTEVEKEAEDGVIKKEDKEAIQTKLDDVQKEIDAEKAKVQELQNKLDKIKEDNSGVIEDEEVAEIVSEIQDKITKENDKITANENYKKEIEDKLNKIEVIDIEKLTSDLSDIEKRTNTLEENDNTKKSDITKLEEEVKIAETNGGTDVLGKKKLDEGIADIKKRQKEEKTERNSLEKELQDLIAGNEKALENDSNLKEKADALKEKINALKETIEKDDIKIKELEEKVKTLEAEKEALAKAAMDKKEQEQKEREKEAEVQEKDNGKVADANNKPTTRNNAVASNSKKNNSKNTSNNKIPHAGAGSVIMLTIITFGVIIYTKKIVNKK